MVIALEKSRRFSTIYTRTFRIVLELQPKGNQSKQASSKEAIEVCKAQPGNHQIKTTNRFGWKILIALMTWD
jgi:hypothetical protein